MFNVLRKTLRDKRFLVIGWMLGIALLSYTITVMYPSFSGTMIEEMTQSLPAAMQGFVGDIGNLQQIDGFVGSQIYEINIPIFIFIFAVLLAIGLTVGEEDKGQLRTLVALPVSRRRILFAKWLAVAIFSLLIAVATTLGTYAGLWQINETMGTMSMVNLTVLLWLLTLAVATIILSVGLATGSRALTVTIGVIVAAGSYLLTTFAYGVEWLRNVEWLSILHYFPAPDIARGTVELRDVLVYVGIIVVMLVAAAIFFPRRSIKS